LPHDFDTLGLRLEADALGPHARPYAAHDALAATAAGGLALLPHLAAFDASGPDAAAFLQAQLTNDVAAIPPDGVGLGAYCSPKGRMIATAWIARATDGFRLVTSREIVDPARRRLSMYVLRAKLALHDRSASHAVLGLYGEAAPDALESLDIAAPAAQRVAWRDDRCAIGLAPVDAGGASIARWLLVVPVERLAADWHRLADRLAPIASDIDRWLEIRSGIARVTGATREAYVPQMVNFEVVDGVGFRKGCYPGQEIVARTQYLGKLKRRMFAATLPSPPADIAGWAPGAPVAADGVAEPVGSVVLSAPAPDGGVALLVEYRMQAAGDAPLRVAGAALVPDALPYALPAAG
jgi:folate-binding protein YgfZ